MNANDELNAAVTRRIEKEIAFKEDIIRKINAIIDGLAYCDPTNAASTLDLSQNQLREVIEKLNNTDDIFGEGESRRIADTLNGRNLRRGLEPVPAVPGAIPSAVPAAVAAPGVPGTAAKTYAQAVRRVPPPAPAGQGLLGRIGDTFTNLATATSPPPAGYVPPKRGGRKTRRRRKTRR
jgi:uncharacterized coiled-coil protein SlyX